MRRASAGAAAPAATSGGTSGCGEHTVQRSGVLLTVSYDGTSFAGFARQSTERTISGELDGAVRAIDATASLVRGASRTDAGVHARGQPVAFDSALDIPSRGWVLGLNSHLPSEIAVVRAARVADGWDPRHHALGKVYRYVVFESRIRDPLLANRAWRVGERLNHRVIAAEAQSLIGEHDFRAFRGALDERENTVRHIFRAEVRIARSEARCLEIEIEGDRFLYRMMRIIAGTLVDVGRGRIVQGAIARALESGSRSDLGITAPPDGLYLDRVMLNDYGRDAWPDAQSIDGSLTGS